MAGFQPDVPFCPNHMFRFFGSSYPSTRRNQNDGGNPNGPSDSNNPLTAQKIENEQVGASTNAPDLPGIGRLQVGTAGVYINRAYIIRTTAKWDPQLQQNVFVKTFCGVSIKGFPTRSGDSGSADYLSIGGVEKEDDYNSLSFFRTIHSSTDEYSSGTRFRTAYDWRLFVLA